MLRPWMIAELVRKRRERERQREERQPAVDLEVPPAAPRRDAPARPRPPIVIQY